MGKLNKASNKMCLDVTADLKSFRLELKYSVVLLHIWVKLCYSKPLLYKSYFFIEKKLEMVVKDRNLKPVTCQTEVTKSHNYSSHTLTATYPAG